MAEMPLALLYEQEAWLREQVAKYQTQGVQDVAAAIAAEFNNTHRQASQPYISAGIIHRRFQQFGISLKPDQNGRALPIEGVPQWDTLSKIVQESYLLLRRSAKMRTDDGYWLLEHPTTILNTAFGVSTGLGRYGTLKKLGLLITDNPGNNRRPRSQKLVHLEIPADSGVGAKPSSPVPTPRKPQLPILPWESLTEVQQRTYQVVFDHSEPLEAGWRKVVGAPSLIKRALGSSWKYRYRWLKECGYLVCITEGSGPQLSVHKILDLGLPSPALAAANQPPASAKPMNTPSGVPAWESIPDRRPLATRLSHLEQEMQRLRAEVTKQLGGCVAQVRTIVPKVRENLQLLVKVESFLGKTAEEEGEVKLAKEVAKLFEFEEYLE